RTNAPTKSWSSSSSNAPRRRRARRRRSRTRCANASASRFIRARWRGRWCGEKKTALLGRNRVMSPVGVEPEYVLEQYEALRREAVDVAPFGPHGHGLALLVTRGLPAWLTALTALVPPTSTRPVDEPPAERAPRLLSTVRGELTTVLASLVLACAQPREGQI